MLCFSFSCYSLVCVNKQDFKVRGKKYIIREILLLCRLKREFLVLIRGEQKFC